MHQEASLQPCVETCMQSSTTRKQSASEMRRKRQREEVECKTGGNCGQLLIHSTAHDKHCTTLPNTCHDEQEPERRENR